MTHPRHAALLPLASLGGLLALSCGSCQGAGGAPLRVVPPGAVLAEASVPTSPTPEELDATKMSYELIEGEPMFTVLPADGIPAIDDPSFVPADEAMDWMDLDETVLGVVGKDGTAKCYSAWLLDGHEIVNDTLDGQPITATW